MRTNRAMHTPRRHLIRTFTILAFLTALAVPVAAHAAGDGSCPVPSVGDITVDCAVSDPNPAFPGIAIDVTVDDGTRTTDVHADGDLSDNHPAYACMRNVSVGDQGPYRVGVCKSES